jgi:hypothetical protein
MLAIFAIGSDIDGEILVKGLERSPAQKDDHLRPEEPSMPAQLAEPSPK